METTRRVNDQPYVITRFRNVIGRLYNAFFKRQIDGGIARSAKADDLGKAIVAGLSVSR